MEIQHEEEDSLEIQHYSFMLNERRLCVSGTHMERDIVKLTFGSAKLRNRLNNDG